MGMEHKWNICSQMWHAFTPLTIHSYFTAGFHFFIVLQFLRNTQNSFHADETQEGQCTCVK